MTQALDYTLNSLQTIFRVQDTNTESNNDAAFDKVLDKAVDAETQKSDIVVSDSNDTNVQTYNNDVEQADKNNIEIVKYDTDSVKTIGDIKNAIKDALSEKFADFKDILVKATDEANVEKSLEVTLSRDINEIIAQLKAIISNTDKEDEKCKNAEELICLLEQLVNTSLNNSQQVLNNTNLVNNETLENNIINLTSKTITETAENNLEDDISSETLDKDMLKELNIESVETETGSSENESLMQNQTPEEIGVKVMIGQETGKFDSVLSKVEVQTNVPTPKEISSEKIVEQIVKHMDKMQNGSKVNIVLNPESLGKVNLQVINTKEGLTAQFTVATNEARELLMKGLDGLKQSLFSHGVGVENISVKLSEAEKSSYNQDWTEQDGSRGGNKQQGQPNKEEKEKGLFEKTIAKTIKSEKENV